MSLNRTASDWTSGAVADPTFLHAEIRDPINGIQAAWDTYTVSWTGATTNPTLGNGTISGRYLRVGKTIDVLIMLTWGSTTTAGSGTWGFSLPVAAKSGIGSTLQVAVNRPGQAINAFPGFTSPLTGSATGTMWYPSTSTTGDWNTIDSTAPGSWTLNDTLRVYGRYEAA